MPGRQVHGVVSSKEGPHGRIYVKSGHRMNPKLLLCSTASVSSWTCRCCCKQAPAFQAILLCTYTSSNTYSLTALLSLFWPRLHRSARPGVMNTKPSPDTKRQPELLAQGVATTNCSRMDFNTSPSYFYPFCDGSGAPWHHPPLCSVDLACGLAERSARALCP